MQILDEQRSIGSNTVNELDFGALRVDRRFTFREEIVPFADFPSQVHDEDVGSALLGYTVQIFDEQPSIDGDAVNELDFGTLFVDGRFELRKQIVALRHVPLQARHELDGRSLLGNAMQILDEHLPIGRDTMYELDFGTLFVDGRFKLREQSVPFGNRPLQIRR